GHQIRLETTGLSTPNEFGQDIGSVAQQGDGNGFFGGRVLRDEFQRVVNVTGLLVNIARAQAEIDTALLAFNVQRAGSGQGGGQGLCAAHTAQAGGQKPFARQVVVVVLATSFHKRL